jgi:hypothetical protein
MVATIELPTRETIEHTPRLSEQHGDVPSTPSHAAAVVSSKKGVMFRNARET